MHALRALLCLTLAAALPTPATAAEANPVAAAVERLARIGRAAAPRSRPTARRWLSSAT